MLTVQGVKLEVADYTQCMDGYTYTDYVKDNLGGTSRNVYEELRYVVMPPK
jgi:hypothetical protein